MCIFLAELMTYVSEGCSKALVSSGALSVLLDLMAKTNRSAASLHVVKTIVRILLNVTKVSLTHWRLNVI